MKGIYRQPLDDLAKGLRPEELHKWRETSTAINHNNKSKYKLQTSLNNPTIAKLYSAYLAYLVCLPRL
jgi:hypothetical protein